MKVGSLVRRKPHPITRQPEILGLVTEMISAVSADNTDASAIKIALIVGESRPGSEKHWRNASHFEVVS